MFKGRWQTALQYLVPQHALSRLMGIIGNCQIAYLKNRFIAWFVRRYDVDMSIAQQQDPFQYPNFNSFFTRQLQPEARPIVDKQGSIVCPVDGVVSQIGVLKEGHLLQAKGYNYDVTQLLGGIKRRSASFLDGHFATLYLAPGDYHRVHMPLEGILREMIYIPGELFSVNNRTAEQVSNLFTRNERVVCIFETSIGLMAVIFVGAMIVGSISTIWKGPVTSPRKGRISQWVYHEQIIRLHAGDEIGHFKMGSTVIVLFPREQISWAENLQANQKVQFGQLIGRTK